MSDPAVAAAVDPGKPAAAVSTAESAVIGVQGPEEGSRTGEALKTAPEVVALLTGETEAPVLESSAGEQVSKMALCVCSLNYVFVETPPPPKKKCFWDLAR